MFIPNDVLKCLDLIARTIAKEQDPRYCLQALEFSRADKRIRAAATNGHYLFVLSWPEQTKEIAEQYPTECAPYVLQHKDGPILVNAAELTAAIKGRLQVKHILSLSGMILAEESHELVSTDAAKIMRHPLNTVEGNYPNWARIIPKNGHKAGPVTIGFNAKYVSLIHDAAAALQGKSHHLPVRWNLPKDVDYPMTFQARHEDSEAELLAVLMPLSLKALPEYKAFSGIGEVKVA